MTVLEAHQLFPSVGLVNGVTIRYAINANGVIKATGVASGINADASKAIWWVIAYALDMNGGPVSDVIYPPNQIFNNFI